MFRAHRAHHQERQIVSIQPLVAVGGCVVNRSETDLFTTQPPTQIVSPDDEHDVLERRRELKNKAKYEGWNFNSGSYLFTTDTK